MYAHRLPGAAVKSKRPTVEETQKQRKEANKKAIQARLDKTEKVDEKTK